MVRANGCPSDPQGKLARIRQKEAVVADLIAGRLRLLEAAARFCQVEVGRTEPPLAERESWCRTVIGWASLALADRPERATLLADQLEGQLAVALAG